MDQARRIDSDARPLAGRRVVVTRTRAQASTLSATLRELGAEPIEIPTIAIAEPADDGAALAASTKRLDDYRWVVLTSPNGARRFLRAVEGSGATVPSALGVASVGTATARVLRDAGIKVDLVPGRQVAEGLVGVFPPPGDSESTHVLLPQAEAARPILADGLSVMGWSVDRVVAYRTIDAAISDAQRAAARLADIVTFTSSSTVSRFCDRVGIENLPPIVACIGPVTAATARDRGLRVTVEAEDHSIDGLVQAVVAFVQSSP